MFVRTESFKEFIRYYPIISAIVFIHIALYVVSLLPIFPNYWLFETMAGINLNIVQGEFWRLVTPIFLHAGFAHMLFNSFSLVIFGPPLEQLLGKVRFLIVYLGSGVLANISTLVLEPLTYTHVGSSGAIFGLFGVYLAMILFRKDLMSYQNRQVIVPIIVIGLIMTFIQPNINISGHIFGLISGFCLGILLLGKRREFAQSVKMITYRTRTSASRNGKMSSKAIWIAIGLLALLGLLSR